MHHMILVPRHPVPQIPLQGPQLVRCGPATWLQPRLPHDLHCQLSSMFVRVTRTVLCSSRPFPPP